MIITLITLHSWNPPSPPLPLLKGSYDLQKIELPEGGGVPKFLLEWRDNPEKGGCVEMGAATFLLLLFSIAFTVRGGEK